MLRTTLVVALFVAVPLLSLAQESGSTPKKPKKAQHKAESDVTAGEAAQPEGTEGSTEPATPVKKPKKKPSPPADEPAPSAAPEGEESPVATASPEADSPSKGPRAKAAASVAKLITAHLKLETPLDPADVRDWGLADVNSDRSPELIFSWSQGTVSGGVALTTRGTQNVRLLAMMKLKDPVLQVRPVPLAGDRSHHLLVRAGADQARAGSRRRTLILAWTPAGFRKIWERTDMDEIAGNPDLSKARRATISEVTFLEGIGGKPGSLVVKTSRFLAQPGKGEELATDQGEETHRYVYDRASGKLVEKRAPAAVGEPEAGAEASPAPDGDGTGPAPRPREGKRPADEPANSESPGDEPKPERDSIDAVK